MMAKAVLADQLAEQQVQAAQDGLATLDGSGEDIAAVEEQVTAAEKARQTAAKLHANSKKLVQLSDAVASDAAQELTTLTSTGSWGSNALLSGAHKVLEADINTLLQLQATMTISEGKGSPKQTAVRTKAVPSRTAPQVRVTPKVTQKSQPSKAVALASTLPVEATPKVTPKSLPSKAVALGPTQPVESTAASDSDTEYDGYVSLNPLADLDRPAAVDSTAMSDMAAEVKKMVQQMVADETAKLVGTYFSSNSNAAEGATEQSVSLEEVKVEPVVSMQHTHKLQQRRSSAKSTDKQIKGSPSKAQLQQHKAEPEGLHEGLSSEKPARDVPISQAEDVSEQQPPPSNGRLQHHMAEPHDGLSSPKPARDVPISQVEDVSEQQPSPGQAELQQHTAEPHEGLSSPTPDRDVPSSQVEDVSEQPSPSHPARASDSEWLAERWHDALLHAVAEHGRVTLESAEKVAASPTFLEQQDAQVRQLETFFDEVLGALNDEGRAALADLEPLSAFALVAQPGTASPVVSLSGAAKQVLRKVDRDRLGAILATQTHEALHAFEVRMLRNLPHP